MHSTLAKGYPRIFNRNSNSVLVSFNDVLVASNGMLVSQNDALVASSFEIFDKVIYQCMFLCSRNFTFSNKFVYDVWFCLTLNILAGNLIS